MSRPALSLLAALPLLLVAGCDRSPRPDNVVLIVVDTLRADHLGLYGYSRPTSPHLDRWAAAGVVFEQALAPSPWTLPTFGSILTGMTPPRHGAGRRAREAGGSWRRTALEDSIPTLAERLLGQGFRTGAVVNNPFLRPHFGLARGFEHYDYEKGRKADAAVDRALDWITAHADEPFFLLLHLIDPHLPYGPPASTRGRFADAASPDFVPRGRKNLVEMLAELSDHDRQLITGRYDEEVAFVDEELDRLLRFIDERGMWESTLVILTSDHGEELFDHGGFEHGHTMFHELLRVPLVVWSHGVEPHREPIPVSLIDLAPTVLAAVGGSRDADFEGSSLWQTMVTKRSPPRRELFAENILWGSEQKSLVAWPYKVILEAQSGHQQLFHLEDDPHETRNLVPEQGTLAEALAARLQAVIQDGDDAPGEVALSEEMEEELRALGYLD